MIKVDATNERFLKTIALQTDFAVVGGGLAGVSAAITAARHGLKVVLVQDRPVLGGNASSEVRLWALGATSHQGNNNRWAREGGFINELMIENTWRNKEGNPLLFDALLLEKVRLEENITLLLNTSVISMNKKDKNTIAGLRAYSTQDFILYDVSAPRFCDASGDGILGYLSGAAFRVGAEGAEEFGEPFAPDQDYGELLGHTIYFYSKDTGKPVDFVAPEFALKDITQIPRYDQITSKSHGCSLWWLEYGGRLNTIDDTEAIKWELWKVAYGVWNYLKNSGKFPEMVNHTLEWMGNIPGKRESRRFEGDYMISQSDVIEQKRHEDAVSFGGWAVDLHPSDGVYSEKSGCTQYHSKGVYQIPYRTMYSRNINNLFIAGRLISASHIAFGSTRVMMTTAHNAQAVGMAAAICHEQDLNPRDLLLEDKMSTLQTRLLRTGHFIPHHQISDCENLALKAELQVSSTRELDTLLPGSKKADLNAARALLFPAPQGELAEMSFVVNADNDCELEFQLRTSQVFGNFTPDTKLKSKCILITAGQNQQVTVQFDHQFDQAQYAFCCVMPCEGVSLALSDELISGLMTVSHIADPKVAKNAVQYAPEESGFDSFEFWIPERRPGGQLPAVSFNPPLQVYSKDQLISPYRRPFIESNTWVADKNDPEAKLILKWNKKQSISRITLSFDSDFDHAMESVQFGHFDRAMPFCIKSYRLLDFSGNILKEDANNHHDHILITLEKSIETDGLILELLESHGAAVAVNSINVYS
ncbi:fumarate reductase/succinate dehydrogenase flavoprotein-like protein [Lentisphaera araneosa HTCC2155]|jgi:hypothetical protein|uniref:Fumarate reductase/succinate dehydrogenase flavoprotein-like protein n=1 Tax=Lentisphaera araneosa HTCC2155 TaxID=313628 RepID=A6DPV6_9BACT|nr:FAD-dependent oxidoreductase [Lentisphaera araneosa]EDM26401.1 fumarate reductase/succinate dehydrogenase flavoprotein-like protein [Lentisphaera araneosa HTCC2155]